MYLIFNFFSFFGRVVHHLRHFLGSGVQINFREGEVENYLVGRVLGEGASAVVKEGFGKMRITGWCSR